MAEMVRRLNAVCRRAGRRSRWPDSGVRCRERLRGAWPPPRPSPAAQVAGCAPGPRGPSSLVAPAVGASGAPGPGVAERAPPTPRASVASVLGASRIPEPGALQRVRGWGCARCVPEEQCALIR